MVKPAQDRRGDKLGGAGRPAVNLNLEEPFCSVRRLHMPSWLSAATSLAAMDARVWKNTLAKRRM
jgi:hypothetical protein